MSSSPYEFGWSLLERDELLAAMADFDIVVNTLKQTAQESEWLNYQFPYTIPSGIVSPSITEVQELCNAINDVTARWKEFKKLIEK